MIAKILLGCLLVIAMGCMSVGPLVPELPLGDIRIAHRFDYNALMSQLGEGRLSRAVEQPNAEGALGRNKAGYFHVRFQFAMVSITDFAIVAERLDALEAFRNVVNYSFSHQLADGSFEFSAPSELTSQPDYIPPRVGDLVSGVAFFSSSLGTALRSLHTSEWFRNDAATSAIREELENHETDIEKLLDYLIGQQDILKEYDAIAPNRLLIDAIAFYTLGKHLQREDGMALAREFLQMALAQVDKRQGYFVEKGGFDSSYNGVAIKLAMELASLMDFNETTELENAILSATVWQLQRITEDGEIITTGNSRVYPGGESFLGNEKGVDYRKTARALYYFGALTDVREAEEVADRVLDFYSSTTP